MLGKKYPPTQSTHTQYFPFLHLSHLSQWISLSPSSVLLESRPPLSPTPTSSTSTAANHLSPPVGGLQSLAGLRFRTLVSKIIVLTIISNVDLSSILFIAHHSLDEEDYKSLRKAILSIQIQSKTETESSSLFRNSPDRLHHIWLKAW